MIDVQDLPDRLRKPGGSSAESSSGVEPLLIEEQTRRHALKVLESVDGTKLRMAELLGISRGMLYRLLGETAAK